MLHRHRSGYVLTLSAHWMKMMRVHISCINQAINILHVCPNVKTVSYHGYFNVITMIQRCFIATDLECLRNQSRTEGEDWSTANKLKPRLPPSNFIAGRPKVALLLWFYGGFRCGVWVCLVILVRYKNRK